jgi:type IV pilus assembly protein PilW
MLVRHPRFRALHNDRGFTLVEIMIALLIGIFLMGALITIVQANRTAFGNQNQLAQLQDSERMAMTMMTDVIQSAGYFPDPTNNTLTGSLTAAAPFAAGESINGAAGDQISVRYMTAGGDGILNCSGQSNPNPVGGANILYVNTFQVLTPAGSTTSQLVCNLYNGANNTTTQYNLVNGVTQLAILYGVKASATAAGNNVDTYMTASQVTAAGLWGSVISALVQLKFTNPMYVASQATDAVNQPTVSLQRVIGVMNKAGPVE